MLGGKGIVSYLGHYKPSVSGVVALQHEAVTRDACFLTSLRIGFILLLSLPSFCEVKSDNNSKI